MMSADVDIVNTALALLGLEAVAAITDDNPRARAMQRAYGDGLAAELRAHRWSFAMTRTIVAADATAPAYGYAYAYTLPVDCVRLDYIGDTFVGVSLTDYRIGNEAGYQVEGRKILSDHGAGLKIRYVRLTLEAASYDPLFVAAFAANLAIANCLLLTESNAKLQGAKEVYKDAIASAVRVAAIEEAPEPIPDDTWVLARR
jgi:hypothetical protein